MNKTTDKTPKKKRQDDLIGFRIGLANMHKLEAALAQLDIEFGSDIWREIFYTGWEVKLGSLPQEREENARKMLDGAKGFEPSKFTMAR